MPVRWSDHGVRRDILRAAFGDWFGLEGASADVLIALFDRQGNPLSWQALATAADSHRPPTRGALHQRICILRKAMECEAVDCDEVGGYSLTEVGVAECRKALQDMAMRLAMIGGEIPE